MSESPYEDDRFFRILHSEPSIIGDLKATTENLGFGGAFVRFDGSNQSITKGDSVKFHLQIEEGSLCEITGKVVWVRKSDKNISNGMGVKFTYMNKEDQEKINDFVFAKKISSFIPRGY